jgi:ribosome-binding protein aMBF1 (putative translation factor)
MKTNTGKFQSLTEFKQETYAKKPGVKKAYSKLEPKYTIIRQLIEARIKTGLVQKQLAKKMGTKQSAIARLESGKANPTIDFIQKLAKALGTNITLTFFGN